MTVHRIVGIETEYGISAPAQPGVTPTALSTQVVNAYAANRARARRTGWDYQEENPLRDARGFDLARSAADPGLLTDEEPGMANLVLTNGARFYVDHAHPEYSAPEVTNPRDAVLWDVAGERVLARAAEIAAAGEPPIGLYKNNTDNKGASYGCHENYLTSRSTPFAALVAHLTPFFVTRQVFAGAGRVGIGANGQAEPGFQLSQRADFIEVEVGLETTLKRPIINTRDEPHADPALHRRLHVIIGDANCSQVATYLKLGTTSLVLAMIEAGDAGPPLTLVEPVAEVGRVSHDTTLTHRLRLTDGRRLTAIEVQREYLERVHAHLARVHGGAPDEQTADVLQRWAAVLDQLERDPFELADQLDWVAKLSILESYRRRDGMDWSHPKLALIDLQYSDVRLDKGLAHRLVAAGRMQRLVSEEEVARAVVEPPQDTRAYFRGQCLALFGTDVVAASWDSVIFELPGHVSLQRVPTLDPYRGTRAHVGELLASCSSASDLVSRLTRR